MIGPKVGMKSRKDINTPRKTAPGMPAADNPSPVSTPTAAATRA